MEINIRKSFINPWLRLIITILYILYLPKGREDFIQVLLEHVSGEPANVNLCWLGGSRPPTATNWGTCLLFST